MLKELVVFMLISITLSASPAEELLKDINTTYSKESYQKIFKNLNKLTISSFETNSTQKMIKEDFEKILPKYLSTKNLFSASSLKELKKANVHKYKWREFTSASLIYMKYLETIEKMENAKKIMERNLINFNSLMTKSDDMIDYILALVLYEKTFTYMNFSLQEMTAILEEHPPPNKSIYFEKVNAERNSLLYLISKMNDIDKKEMKNYDTSDYKKLMTHVRSSAKEYVNIYFNKMELAIKSESQQKMNSYYKYIEEEENSHMSLWSEIKFLFHTIMAKIFQIFVGYNIHHDYIAEFMGKTIALVSVPKIVDAYTEHIKMVQQYSFLIKKGNVINDITKRSTKI